MAVKKYLSIEQIKYGERLIVDFSIESDTLKIPVLGFIIQPFLEHTIWNGLSSNTLTLLLIVSAFKQNGSLISTKLSLSINPT